MIHYTKRAKGQATTMNNEIPINRLILTVVTRGTATNLHVSVCVSYRAMLI